MRARSVWSGGGTERRALVGWAALIAVAGGAGAVLHGLGVLRIDHLPPLHAHFRVLTFTLLPAVLFAVVAVRVLPGLVRRGGFGRASLIAYGFALAWTFLLAVSADGPAAPFTHPQEYLAVLPAVGDDPLGWLAGFTRHLPEYPTHVRGHPPLPVLVVWALAAVGLPGPLWAAIVVIAAGCSATVAIGLTVRHLAGEEAARRALPYLALTPASVWIATTMDAFFAGVGAWGVALLVLGIRSPAKDRYAADAGDAAGMRYAAATRDAGRPGYTDRAEYAARSRYVGRLGYTAGAWYVSRVGWYAARAGDAGRSGYAAATGYMGRLGYAAGAGVLLGALPYLSYGLVPYLAIPVAVAVLVRPSWPVVAAVVAGAAAVTAAFAAAGFSWPAGVAATHAEWAADPGAARPYWYFLVANLAVLALITGPATAMGLARLLPRLPRRQALPTATVLDMARLPRRQPFSPTATLDVSSVPHRRSVPGAVVLDMARFPRRQGAAALDVPPAPRRQPLTGTATPDAPRLPRRQALTPAAMLDAARRHGTGTVVAAALVAVLALDISGVTRGEVERIWLPFAVWIGLAAAYAPARRMLAVQALTGLLLQCLVASPW
ncbi:hypothetical protein ACFFWE_10760 [Sphaerisporangium melleum]|uniref:hypothetical protein n=1 Tax=Sphaerisporangium melleum TaxID=321316 RepID=UPI0019528482|nr:hypothetical protein [Sphaerisporangium melleum]